MPNRPAPPDPLQTLIPLLGLIQQMRQQNQQQGQNILQRLPGGGAGMTATQAGLSPKQQKALYGRTLGATDVVAPETPETAQNQMMLARLKSMSPGEVDNFTSGLVARAQGVPGLINRAGLTAGSQAGQAEAETNLVKAKTGKAVADSSQAYILQGLDALNKAPEAVRTSIGQKMGVGTTAEETTANDLSTQITTASKRLALQALADPKHPLNTLFKSTFGINAIEALPAVGLGMANLLGDIGQIVASDKSGNKALEVAKWQFGADAEKDLLRVENDWAKGVADQLKGTVSPRTVLLWKRWRETPDASQGTRPAGVTPELDTLLSNAASLGYQATVTKAAEDGDPYAKQMQSLANVAEKVTNPQSAAAIGQLMTTYFGKVVAGKELGVRPTDPAGQRAWDQRAEAITAKMPKLDSHHWFTGGGVTVNNNPAGAAPPPAQNPMMLNLGGQQQPQGGAQLMGGQPPPGISPEDLKNLQTFIQAFTSNPPVSLTPATIPKQP